ncbi:hypothetical protein ES703_90718 [subsurface metagenome]
MWIENNGTDAFVRAIMELRNIANDLRTRRKPSKGHYVSSVRVEPRQRARRIAESDDVTSRAVHLFKHDLRLSVRRAAEMLRPTIEKHARNNLQYYMPRPKEGLTRWIERVRQVVPDSLLLHEITAIRNKVIHDEGQDWPLREREE